MASEEEILQKETTALVERLQSPAATDRRFVRCRLQTNQLTEQLETCQRLLKEKEETAPALLKLKELGTTMGADADKAKRELGAIQNSVEDANCDDPVTLESLLVKLSDLLPSLDKLQADATDATAAAAAVSEEVRESSRTNLPSEDEVGTLKLQADQLVALVNGRKEQINDFEAKAADLDADISATERLLEGCVVPAELPPAAEVAPAEEGKKKKRKPKRGRAKEEIQPSEVSVPLPPTAADAETLRSRLGNLEVRLNVTDPLEMFIRKS